jgi:hypothetical protein
MAHRITNIIVISTPPKQFLLRNIVRPMEVDIPRVEKRNGAEVFSGWIGSIQWIITRIGIEVEVIFKLLGALLPMAGRRNAALRKT